MKSSKTRWWATAGAVSAIVAIAACGSSAKTAATSSTATSSTAAPTATTAAPSAGSTAASGGSTATTTGAGGTATISGPGVTATEIKIGQIATVSGPVPGLFQNSADSMDAYVAYINSLGGVDGHKLVVVHKDDAYDCVSYTNEMKTFAKTVFAMVGTFSVEGQCGQAVLKANPNFADFEAYILNPLLYSSPNAFSSEAQPSGYITTGYVYVKSRYPNDITHTGALYASTSSFSYTTQSAAAKSVGYKYVYARGLGTTETNFTADILRMKSAGVKIVDLGATALNTLATFEAEAAQQGFHPDAVICPSGYDANFFKLAGSTSNSVVGNMIAPLLFPMYLGQDRAINPELNTYLTWLDKTHPGDSANLFGTSSWAAGVQFVQSIQAAGSNVTQAGVIKAATNLGNFTANGLLPGSDPGKRLGAHCMLMVGVNNGKFVRLDPPTSGFECNGSYFYLPLSAAG